MTGIKEKIDTAIKLHSSGNLVDAEKLYLEAMSEAPLNADVFNLYGLLKYQQKNYEEAIDCIKNAINLKPSAYFYDNLGRVYADILDISNAIDCFKKAINLDKNNPDLWFQVAALYKNSGFVDAAISAYKKTISLKKDSASAYFNLGNIYASQNKAKQAIDCFKKVIEINPDDKEAKICLGQMYFLMKDFKNGKEYFENRISRQVAIFTQQQTNNKIIQKPQWDGADISNKTIYCYYEAGFGDTIQFVRYLPVLSQKAKNVYFLAQPDLVKLLKNSNLNVEILDTSSDNLSFDEHIPLMSLPNALNLDFYNIPSPQGHLKAEEDKISFYKENYFDTNKFKIGIKWQGRTYGLTNRAIPLNNFFPLFKIKEARYYSFQKDEGVEQIKELPFNYDMISLGETFNDFADTAAALKNLDLFICNDTSLAHLSAALGVPTWILLPYQPEWRWFLNDENSPWYSSAKIYRQKRPYDWEEVLERVAKNIVKIID